VLGMDTLLKGSSKKHREKVKLKSVKSAGEINGDRGLDGVSP